MRAQDHALHYSTLHGTNQLAFVKVVGESIVSWFYDSQCIIIIVTLCCAFSALMLLVGWVAARASSLHKTEWWDVGVVICLRRGADLHMGQLMPLPLTISCSSKYRLLILVLYFWYWLTRVVPDAQNQFTSSNQKIMIH